MKRSYILIIFLLSITLVASWFLLQSLSFGSIITSMVSAEHIVDNNKPIPEFTKENFSNQSSIRCIVVGDWGSGNRLQKAVAQGMNTAAEIYKPTFIISTGDNFYPSGVSSTNDEQWKKHFENIYTGSALRIPWYCVLGNHDYRLNPYAQIEYSRINKQWNMPSNYYMFSQNIDSTSVDFFMIDTQLLYTQKNPENSQQLRWLDSALAQSHSPWKIVVGHHMIRSHGVYGDQKIMLRVLKPLLAQHNVQLYMNGHDHDIQYLQHPDDTFACIISGAGGQSRNTSYGTATKFCSTNGGFVMLAITQSRIHAQFFSSNGTMIYSDDIATHK